MRFCLLAITLLLFAVAPALADAPQQVAISSVAVGFEGQAKAGFLTPVRVTIQGLTEASEAELRVRGVDGDAVPVIYQAGEGNLSQLAASATGQELTTTIYFKVGPQPTPATVELLVQGKIVSEKAISFRGGKPLAATRELVLTIGSPLGMEEAQKLSPRSEDSAYALARVESVDELPDQAWGYEGIDAILLSTSEKGLFAKLTTQQQQAIADYTLGGGRLILSAGSAASDALQNEPWKSLLPCQTAPGTPLRDRVGLETLSGSQLTLGADRPEVLALTNVSGRIELDEGGVAAGRPLAIRGPSGLGEVQVIAIELDHPSIATWKGRSRLLAALMQRTRDQQQQDRDVSRRTVNHLGFTDLVGQLRAALDQFSDVTLVNFTTVAVLTLVYLLIIGPGDYFFVSGLGLPRWITWISFPTTTLLFCLLGWYLGLAAHGTEPKLNHVELIDIDPTTSTIRSTSWIHLYTPQSERLSLSLEPQSPPFQLQNETLRGTLDFQGLPGDGLGGLSSRQVQLADVEPYFASPPSVTTHSSRLEQLPLQSASSKSISGRWTAKATGVSKCDLRMGQYGLLAGTVSSPIDVPLSQCLLVYGEWLYRIDKLSPGQPVSIDRISPLNLEARLTQKMVVGEKDVSTPWNQQSTDLPRILQMMMFYDSVRGANYTGLSHRYQTNIDFTNHLRGGRAVLVGNLDSPVSTIKIDDQPIVATKSITLIRVVLPVAPLEPKTTAASGIRESSSTTTTDRSEEPSS